METATLASVGWAAGTGLSWLVLYLLKVTLFAPRGHDLSVIAWVPILLSIPIPTAVVGFTLISVRRVLSRLDPVAVVERGELSQAGGREQRMRAFKSSPRPLASATFYKRHRRRAALLISAMSLMIVAVVLLFFVDAVMADAHQPGLGYLRRVSIVRSPGADHVLDPGVVTQVRTHPVCPVVRSHSSIPDFKCRQSIWRLCGGHGLSY
jgi:hypothetical protein